MIQCQYVLLLRRSELLWSRVASLREADGRRCVQGDGLAEPFVQPCDEPVARVVGAELLQRGLTARDEPVSEGLCAPEVTVILSGMKYVSARSWSVMPSPLKPIRFASTPYAVQCFISLATFQ